MKNTCSISAIVKKTFVLFHALIVVQLFILGSDSVSAQAQFGAVGPGKGSFEGNHITGKFEDWDRKATPMLVLRVHGAGRLQTFAEISADGAFEIALPEIPAEGNYGSLTCGDPGKGGIVVVTDFSLLTNLPGFSSPGRYDRGYSEIGMATFADEKFAKNIGKPGGRRANWLYSKTSRTVEAGECNNTNSFQLAEGWNAFTVTSGASGGPHTYKPGLDADLGWYWYAFPEDAAQQSPSNPPQNSQPDGNPDPPAAGGTPVQAGWLFGEWDGVQMDTRIQMRLQSTGEVWLESIESGRKKTMEGKWSLNNGEFVLDIKEGVMRFNIQQTSETGFRLFGKAARSDIVFTRKK